MLKDLRKIEHVVLYRYYLLAETTADLLPAGEISKQLSAWIAPRRVEVAIDALVANAMLEDEFLPHGRPGWRITRRGLEFVDRQLKQPTSFLSRLATYGIEWLASEEAAKANITASSDQPINPEWKDEWEGHEITLDLPSSEDGGYLNFADRILIAIADEQEPPGLSPVGLEEIAKRRGIKAQATWLKLVGSDLQGRGLGRTVGSGPGYKFLLNGVGLNTANKLREAHSSDADDRPRIAAATIDWGKWGTILTGIGILVAIIIAMTA